MSDWLRRSKKVLPVAALTLLLIPAVILVGKRQLSPKASNSISVQVSPGAINQSSSPQIGKPVYLSATAVSDIGQPITSGVTYSWGISSTFPTSPSLKTNDNLATFTPASTGSGTLWVSAITSQSSAIKYLDICVGVPCPSYTNPTPTPVTYDPNNFTDVDKNSWSWKYILQIVPLGLVPPRTPTTFEPTGFIPRVEMAQFLSNTYRYFKSTDAPIVSTPFTDISNLPRNQQDAIARVYGLGLTAGTSTTTFSPTMLVDRAQTAVFLVKLYKLITNIDPPLVKTPFTDLTDPDIAYSQNWVPKLYGLKITAGISPTLYGPKLQVTREQMTAFLSNILHAISTTPTPTPSSPPVSEDFDVVIVGAGTGGISAAISAARLGAKVAIMEETDWIGGQMTAAGVSTIDGTGSGIFTEFMDLVKSHYSTLGKSINTCYWNSASQCFEPQVGQQILLKMIKKEPNINLFLRSHVVSVTKKNKLISSLQFQDASSKILKTINASVFIDASEYGDLLPLLGINYRLGNTTVNDSKVNSCIQDITYTAIVKKYPQGVPSELKMSNPPPGYLDNVASFRKLVSATGSIWDSKNRPVDIVTHNAYRGLPDSSSSIDYSATNYETAKLISKTQINWANDFPVDTKYLQDRPYRFQVNCQAKLKTLQFIYYLQSELGQTQWSIANDEGYDTPYNREENNCPNIPEEFKSIEKQFPVIPYVREGRRGIGSHTLTAREIDRRNPTIFPSSIAVGNYAVDLHNCKSEADLETNLENLSDIPPGFLNGPFQVPFESMLAVDMDNLILAEKNISASRLSNGALRLQPITMATGQAAGTIAALSISKRSLPKNLDYHLVQQKLIEAGAIINFPLPDLAILNPIVANPNPAKVTDQVLISFKISNAGTSAATSAQYSYTNQADGSSQVHSSNTCVNSTSLKPGESCVSAYLFTFKSSGSKTLTVKLDPNNILKESNEKNNDYSVTLTVLSSTPAPTSRPTPTPTCPPPSCAAPPLGCSYQRSTTCSCGTLVCLPIPNKPPTITTQFLSIGFVGRVYSTSVSATDPNLNNSLTAKISGLPPLLALTGCTQFTTSVRNLVCTISGTPNRFGTFPVKITVTDSVGASVSKTINLPIFKKYLLF